MNNKTQVTGPGQRFGWGRLGLATFLILLIFAMFNLFKSSSTAYQNLPAAEFAAGLKKPGTVLLDVRTPAEFAAGHLPGAVNLDVTSPDFARRVATLDKEQPTYVYCRSGARSGTAAAQLSGAGFSNVANLVGGVMDWPEKLVR